MIPATPPNTSNTPNPPLPNRFTIASAVAKLLVDNSFGVNPVATPKTINK